MYLTTSILASLAALAMAAPAPISKRAWSGPYTVTAVAPGHPFNGTVMQAAGEHFYVGPAASPASYCPTEVGDACPNTTTTVMVGSSMDVEVPGGQQMFTQAGGAIAYTQAHSISEPSDYEGGPSVDGYGNFIGFSGEGMAACPVSGETYLWQVFAEVPSFNQTNCVCFRAIAQSWNGSVGAWQYI